MRTSRRIGVAAVLLVGVAAAWMLWPRDATPPPRPASAVQLNEAGAEQVARADPAAAETDRDAAPRRETLAASVAAPGTGQLIVRASYGDDEMPAVGIVLALYRPGGDTRVEGRRQRTDETGTARYASVPPGQSRVSYNSARGGGETVEIRTGETTEIELQLEVGLKITGIVVDRDERPVAGALVEASWMARVDAFPEVVAVTDADGRFAARALPVHCMIGARAAGYTASPQRLVLGRDGNSAEVRLQVGTTGGSVAGQVVDEDGVPIPGAVVVIGDGPIYNSGGRDQAPPLAAMVRSDTEGQFRAIGIPVGEQPVHTRAPGYAPWAGTIEIEGDGTASLHVTLGPGAAVRGIVRNAAGAPAHRAEVEVGSWDDLVHYRARTESNGSYELTGLPPGEVELLARHDEFGRATRIVEVRAGATTSVDLQLFRGLELIGMVIDEDGQPVPEILMECQAEGGLSWFAFARTDVRGRFAAANVPEDATIRVTARGRGIEELRRTGIDPKAGELVLQVRRAEPPSARIAGSVVGPDGRPLPNVMVSARRQEPRDSTGIEPTDGAGRFELGPMVPGSWKVWAHSNEHPQFFSEVLELAAGATWDLAMITLPLGGTAVVRPIGPAIPGATFYAVDEAETGTWVVQEIDGQLRSAALEQGDYRLLVFGEGVAAHTVPFAIQPGEETVVDVQLGPGVLQRFEIALPPDVTAFGSVMLRVQQGDALVGRAFASVRTGKPVTGEIWVAPGDYSVTATFEGLSGSAELTVGESARAPLRIALR